jgi:heme exporter protein A
LNSTGPAVELENIARRFGRRWVLRGLDLVVNAGETVALTGKNGSGKTTLLRVIATLLRPTRGQGRVFGRALGHESGEIRELVNMLGHHSGLYDDLTAAENLRFSMQMYGLDASYPNIEQALDEVGLGRESKERVRGFSAGMRRRLALARMLLRPTSLVLLDEPYAAFDQQGIERVNAYVHKVVSTGGAALIATHDLARAADITTRVVHLDSGLLSGP